jgi:hypothetical protein
MKTDVQAISGAGSDPFHGDRVEWPRARWVVCFLVFAATTINYIDREVMGLLAPILQTALKWSAGALGGVFFAWAAGQLLQTTHDYRWLFIISGSVYLVSLLWFQLMTQRLPDVSEFFAKLGGSG